MSYQKFLYQVCVLSCYSSFAFFSQINPARSQITPNGAGTVVNPQGNQINITGGTQAGANLFHSFRDFNVNSAQIANFLSNPQIQNILARVNGGNPSFINGLLQVTGGNSNLFLMNPAGIVFGQGASLNIPASFTATTANQIGFGNNLFNAFGDNNFSALIGNPDSFIFTTTQAGSIVNAGNLAVGSGQNISLIAGNTINTGRLTSPGGEIQVVAVPGTNRVRLSQPGQVLSLEIVPPVDGTLRAVDLPALLTGSDLLGIQVNPTGQVQVAGTSLPNQQGLAVASGRIDVSSTIGNGGTVQVMGDRVAALNSRINANGATGGGTVLLGGEYLGGRDTGIAPEFRFNSQRTLVDRNSLIRANATVTGEGGRVIVWADQNTGYFGRITGRGATGRGAFVEVSGRENLAFDGRVEIPGANGLFGTLLLDPTNITIVPGANNSQADDGQVNVDATILISDTPANMTISAGALAAIPATTAIDIKASGNIDFQSDITLDGGFAAPSISFTAATVTSGAFTLSTRGRGLNIVANTINIPNLSIDTGLGAFGLSGSIDFTSSQGSIITGNISTSAVNGSGGSINFTSQGDIISDRLGTSTNVGDGGNVNLTAQGNISILGLGIFTTVNTIGDSGAVTLRSQGNILVGNNITTSNANQGNSGAINLNAIGNITTGGINSSSTNSNGGAINLNSQGDITTGIIGAATNTGNGGSINFTTLQGNITTGSIGTAAVTGNGGAVNFTAPGNIITGGVATNVTGAGDGGAISLTSQSSIVTNDITTASAAGSGGLLILNAPNGSIVANSIRSQGTNLGNRSGAIIINAGNLFRVPTLFGGLCGAGTSICSGGLGGAGDGAVNIRHGGGLGTPFTVGNATINGTAGAINAGAGNIPITFNVPPGTYETGNINIITQGPPPPISLDLLLLLLNPTPPATPPPAIVGAEPEPEPVAVNLPSPSPIPIPLPSPSPTPLPLPTPIPIPTPSPLPIPSPTPIPDPPLRTTLTGGNTNPPLPPIVSEPLSGSLTLITNPSSAEISPKLVSLEQSFQNEFQQYLGITPQISSPRNTQETQVILNQIRESTGIKPGLMYIFFTPAEGADNFSGANFVRQTNRIAKDTDILEAVVVTGTGQPVRVRLPGATRRQVIEVANNFRSEVTNFRSSRGFLIPAQQMYKWILEPLEAELQKQGITNLVFLLDSGLRSIPLAAMHDGKGFIVERYSVGLIPSLNLTPLDHIPLQGSQVLAMGATTFGNSGLSPLPAVSLELNTVSQLWQGSEFLNDRFTLNNLIQQRRDTPFRMIHLATHGVFNPGDRSNSYIQLWDQRLGLNQLDQLNWGNPPVDLLVLSACQTALGDKDAELGFAGLAVSAGVRTALASLWQVNDAATLGLMTKFYQQLQVTTTKSESLRQAQLAMIRGEVRLEDGNLVTADGRIPLTAELKELGNLRLNHPYYWSAFTLVGNPW